jgi:hypothetical protein
MFDKEFEAIFEIKKELKGSVEMRPWSKRLDLN